MTYDFCILAFHFISRISWMPYDDLNNMFIRRGFIASVISPITAVVIVVGDKLGDLGFKGMDALILCYGFVTGIAWEKAFFTASEILNESPLSPLHSDSQLLLLTEHLLISLVFLNGFIMPAWVWYILPIASLPVPSRQSSVLPKKLSNTESEE